ncbi:hypothetical protein [Actinoplanes sp. URMC 104]|uniref:hypothetical protein n=1 Tax=Actinoplanes sp. URMC 104 TaxID=3423409 RepID=UPI003F1A63B0
MNRITRMLTVTGLGLIAGVTMGAGPAMAATGTDAGASKTAAATQGADRERIVGFYRSYTSCVIAGRIGERFGRWDDFDCDRVGRRGFALEVSWDRDWDWGHNRHHGGRPFFHHRDRDRFDDHRGGRDRDRDDHDGRGGRDDRDDRGGRDDRDDRGRN